MRSPRKGSNPCDLVQQTSNALCQQYSSSRRALPLILDEWCCDVAWDSLCAEEARASCLLACLADCALPVDGTIDVTDLLKVLADWGSPGDCDTDGSGAIDITDLLQVLGDWGPCL